MANPFEITTARNTVTLNNKRQGVATFTVRNLTGRRVRALARLVTAPPDSLAQAWVGILPTDDDDVPVPTAIRDFDIDATHQYRVQVAAPADAPPGGYSFRLVVADEINPDENFSQSSDMLFTVVPPPVEEKKPLPKWLIPLATVVVLAVVGVVVLLLVLGNPDSPPVTPTLVPTATPVTHANLVAGVAALSPSQPVCAQTFNVGFDVTNLGSSATISGGIVSLQDVHNGTVQASTLGGFPVLNPGQTFRVDMPLTVDTFRDASHTLVLIIDSQNQIPEVNETDNRRELTYTLARGNCP